MTKAIEIIMEENKTRKKKTKTLEDYFVKVETSANSIEDKLARIFEDVQDIVVKIKEIQIEIVRMRDVNV